jgi:uncharacterized membrane protein
MALATAVIIVTLVRGSWIMGIGLTTAALCWATWQTARARKRREKQDLSSDSSL